MRRGWPGRAGARAGGVERRAAPRRAGRAGVHIAWSLLLGLAAHIVLSTLPWLGWLAGALAVLLGVGALVIALVRAGRAPAAPVAAG